MAGFSIRRVETSKSFPNVRGLWGISAPYYSPKLNSAARMVPGTHWDSGLKAHVGYADAIEQVVYRIREMGLRCEDGPVNERDWRVNIPVSYDQARDYQKLGIDFLIANASSGALLADDMGLGKSLEITKACRALRRKTIIVCPAHVRGTWERPKGFFDPADKGGELAKWWPDAVVAAPYGVKPKGLIDPAANVVVLHYDIIHAWVEELLKWVGDESFTIAFDEIHVLLNPTSRRSKACRALAHLAAGRMGATGTPPTDRVKDLYNVVDTLSPGRFGDFFPYAIRHCAAHKADVRGPSGTTQTVWLFDGRSNLPELRTRIEWFTLRRTKREVLKELPALTREIVDIEIKADSRATVNARVVGDKRRMRAALDAAADGKLKSVISRCRNHLEQGQRIVVGTYRREVCEKIADALSEIAPTEFIHGGVALPRRGKIVDKLNKTEGACALVANIDATSTGIDFTFASRMVIAELVWETREMSQFESRVHRYGAKEPVAIEYIIARGTGDELILHAVINKLDTFAQLIEKDGGDGLKNDLAGTSKEDEGLSRLAAALKKMGKRQAA